MHTVTFLKNIVHFMDLMAICIEKMYWQLLRFAKTPKSAVKIQRSQYELKHFAFNSSMIKWSELLFTFILYFLWQSWESKLILKWSLTESPEQHLSNDIFLWRTFFSLMKVYGLSCFKVRWEHYNIIKCVQGFSRNRLYHWLCLCSQVNELGWMRRWYAVKLNGLRLRKC